MCNYGLDANFDINWNFYFVQVCIFDIVVYGMNT